MSQSQSARLQDHFADLTNPRRRELKYLLINVVCIAPAGTTSTSPNSCSNDKLTCNRPATGAANSSHGV
jgi:hypothetical protein